MSLKSLFKHFHPIRALRNWGSPRGFIHEDHVLTYLRDCRAYTVDRWNNFLTHCFVPNVFYDIGANNPFSSEGQQSVLKPIMPETRFYLFEAMSKHERALILSKEPYAIALLGEKNGVQKTFYQSKAYAPGDGDSYYKERTASYESAAVITSNLTTRSLDSLVEELNWPLPDFMKIDTQGSEVDVLRGASKCLAAARGLQIECPVRQYNEGAPLLLEVLSFVQATGFRMYDVSQLHFTERKELLQIDILFLRKDLFKDGD